MAEPVRPPSAAIPWAAIWGWLLFIAVETLTQVVFKYAGATFDAGQGLAGSAIHALTTPVVLAGFALYFLGFLIWMTILKDADLGRAFPMTATIYLSTLACAVLVFHERLNLTRIVGVAIIVVGVLLMASDENSKGAASCGPTGPVAS